ncbi:cytochrome P450 family protein [Nocardiopsis coralliicola]
MSPDPSAKAPPPACPLHDDAVPLPDFATEGIDPADYLEGLRATYGPLAPIDFEDGVAAWLVLDYTVLATVLKDPERFPRASRHWTEQVEGRFRPGMAIHPMFSDRGGLNALCLDGEKHRRRRDAIQWALSTLSVPQAGDDARALADRAIDAFCRDGEADLVEQFASVVPVMLLNRWFGMTQDEFGAIVASMAEQWAAGKDSTRAQHRLVKHATGVAQAKRAALEAGTIQSDNDLVAALVSAPQNLSDMEIAFDLELLIGAAVDPVKNLIGSTLRFLLTDRSAAAEVAGRRVQVSDAVDRVLWSDPPIAAMPGRFPMEDVELGGTAVRAGEGLVPCYLGANRDPKLGPVALESGNQSYLSFGAGPHGCPARSVGTGVVVAAVEALRTRLPDVRLAVPAEELSHLPTLYTRGPAALPVVFAPAPEKSPEPGAEAWNSPSGSTPPHATSKDRPASSASMGLWSRFASLVRSMYGR